MVVRNDDLIYRLASLGRESEIARLKQQVADLINLDLPSHSGEEVIGLGRLNLATAAQAEDASQQRASKPHWTQTPEGKRKLKQRSRKAARLRAGE